MKTPKTNTYQETYYQQKLERAKRRREFWRDFWYVCGGVAIFLAVAALLCATIIGVTGGIRYDNDRSALRSQVEELQNRVRALEPMPSFVYTNGVIWIK